MDDIHNKYLRLVDVRSYSRSKMVFPETKEDHEFSKSDNVVMPSFLRDLEDE